MARSDRKSGCFHWVITLKKSFNERWAKFRNNFIEKFRKSNATVNTREIINDTGTPDLVFTKRPVSPRINDAVIDHAVQRVLQASPKMVMAASTHSLHQLEKDMDLIEQAIQVTHADAKVVTATPSQSAHDLELKDDAVIDHAVQRVLQASPKMVMAASTHSLHQLKKDMDLIEQAIHVTKADAKVVTAAHDLELKAFAANYVKGIVHDCQAKLEAEAKVASPGSPTPSAISDFAGQFSMKVISGEQIKLEAEIKRTSPESMTSSLAEEIADIAVRESLTSITADTNESAQRRPKTVSETIAALGLGLSFMDDGLPRVDI